MDTPALGFIGLGNQGLALARNLVADGHKLCVYDKSPERMDLASACGAVGMRSVAGVADASDVLFVCVATDVQLAELCDGEEGLLSVARPGSTICIHSTVHPDLIVALADRAGTRGVTLIDAPLAGGVAAANSRSLIFMIGGDTEHVARCSKLLARSAKQIFHFGGTGAGIRAKLVHQAVLCGNLVAAREGFSLASALGLDHQIVRDLIEVSKAQSKIAEQFDNIRLSAHDIALLAKDLSMCVEFANKSSRKLGGTSAVRDALEMWRQQAETEQDMET